MKKLLFIMSLLVISSHCLSADTISFDHVSVSGDLTTTKYNADLDTVFQKVNTNVQTDNILDDTLAESDMADAINPRLRTYEGASCEFVYTGLLTTTTTGTLVGSVPSGTAYPLGYRVRKDSATPKTFNGSCSGGGNTGCWTYVDLSNTGTFTYSEVAIGSTAPSTAANSVRLSRVSTDGTQIFSVQDLRTTSCNQGPFTNIKNTSTGASLSDMFSRGSLNKINGSQGFIQGAQISRDTATTFKILPGSVYINGEYRSLSSAITVPVTADDPINGTSGIDTGSISASTRYNVFAIADQVGVSTFSATFSTASAPSGTTNYRKLGSIVTDASGSLVSADITELNNITQREIAGAWIKWSAGTTVTVNGAYNISAITRNAAGNYTITFDQDFNNSNYAATCTASQDSADRSVLCTVEYETVPTYNSIAIEIITGSTPIDTTSASLVIIGER